MLLVVAGRNGEGAGGGVSGSCFLSFSPVSSVSLLSPPLFFCYLLFLSSVSPLLPPLLSFSFVSPHVFSFPLSVLFLSFSFPLNSPVISFLFLLCLFVLFLPFQKSFYLLLVLPLYL